MFSILTKSFLALAMAVGGTQVPAEPQVIYTYSKPKLSLAFGALEMEQIPETVITPITSVDESENAEVEMDSLEAENAPEVIVGVKTEGVEPTKEEIKRKILEYFPNDPIMLEIANCESNFFPRAKNPNSSAKGTLQIIDSTWEHFNCEGDVLDVDDNLACGVKILAGQGLTAWECYNIK